MGKLDIGADAVRGDQPVVSGVSVNLQHTAKALQYPFGMLPAPTRCLAGECMHSPRRGRIGEGHARWCRAAPRSVIAGQRPEVSRLGLSCPRIENRGAGLVHEELGGPLQARHQRIMDGAEFEGGATDPVSLGGAVEVDALAAVDLCLPIERQVIRVFADQHMGDRSLGRHAARNQSSRGARHCS